MLQQHDERDGVRHQQRRHPEGQDGIEAVQATTFPWHLASLGVIKRLGMQPIGTREHDTVGELLLFERRKTSTSTST